MNKNKITRTFTSPGLTSPGPHPGARTGQELVGEHQVTGSLPMGWLGTAEEVMWVHLPISPTPVEGS